MGEGNEDKGSDWMALAPGISAQGGSVTGTAHDVCQDAFMAERDPNTAVCVVSDGCGSAENSEYGATFFSRAVCRTVSGYAGSIDSIGDVHHLVKVCQTEFRRVLHQHLQMLLYPNWDRKSAMNETSELFLATLHILVVTPDFTFAFGAGDGVVWFNDTVVSLEPPLENAPAYPAYSLFPEFVDAERYDASKLSMYFCHRTSDMEFAGVGTDGVDELIERSDEEIRGGDTVGGLDQFRDEKYVEKPYLIGKRLRAIGQVNGKLEDDTTVAFTSRLEGEEG